MPSHRKLRVRELLLREIGEAIRREIPVQQSGVFTVNDVQLSADLRQARVLVGFFGTVEQEKGALKLLTNLRVRIQDHVAQTVVLKFTPKLRFEMDDSIERGNRVLRIIEDIEEAGPAKA